MPFYSFNLIVRPGALYRIMGLSGGRKVGLSSESGRCTEKPGGKCNAVSVAPMASCELIKEPPGCSLALGSSAVPVLYHNRMIGQMLVMIF
jgi:hypothetical protein